MNELFALAIHLIPLLSPMERVHFAERCNDFTTFQGLKGHDIFSLGVGIRQTKTRVETLKSFNGQETWQEAEVLLEKLQKRNIQITHVFEKNYPPTLREIYSPPFLLFYMGKLPNPDLPSLGVVGTRRPSLSAKQETAIFVREVAPYIGSIVSGLAIGVDGTAHRAALAANCHTTAVLGSGFDHIYPSANKKLAADLVHSGGVLITEYSPHITPTTYTFPARNSIISGLSRSIVVIEAPQRSGALITAELALEQGRDIFIHTVGLKPDSGVEKLYSEGALVLERGSDLLTAWGICSEQFIKKQQPIEPDKPAVSEKPIARPGKIYDIARILAESTAEDIGWGDDGKL